MQGPLPQPSFREVTDQPRLLLRSLEPSRDLYLTCQLYGDGERLFMPARTSYHWFNRDDLEWDGKVCIVGVTSERGHR